MLAPTAVAAAAGLLDAFDLATPYPRVVGAGRLVQPLLQWSWLTFLPLRAMERSRRPSLAAAGGQFLAVRRDAYDRAGGHAAVRDRVLEDIELARAVKRAGGRITHRRRLPPGHRAHVRDVGRPGGRVHQVALGIVRLRLVGHAVAVALLLLYAGPPLRRRRGRRARGVDLGRRGDRRLPARGGRSGDHALARPAARRCPTPWPTRASVAVLVWLLARSYRARRRGRLIWKGRRLEPPGAG